MIGRPPHDGRFGLVGAALTMQRNNRHNTAAAIFVKNEIEKLLLSSGYLESAPFYWVTLAVGYGLKNEKKPHYQKINKKYGDLPLSIEIDIQDKRYASLEEMKNVYMRASLIALIHAGKKYARPVTVLEAMLKNL